MPSKQMDAGVQAELDAASASTTFATSATGAAVTSAMETMMFVSLGSPSSLTGPLVASMRLTGPPGCATRYAGSGTAAADANATKRSMSRTCIIVCSLACEMGRIVDLWLARSYDDLCLRATISDTTPTTGFRTAQI